MSVKKILSILTYVLLAVSVIMVGLFYMGGSETVVINGQEADQPFYTEGFIYWSYFLFGLAAIITITFPIIDFIIDIISNPKNAIKTLVPVVGIIIITGIAYTLASDSILTLQGYTGTDNVPNILKYSGTALYVTYILFGLAILTIIASGIRNVIKLK